MKQFFRFIRNFRFANKKEIANSIYSFNITQWILFCVAFVLLSISFLSILNTLNQKFMVSIPANGGNISEGIIGAPRFLNPLLALSDADRDVNTLVFSGLMRKDDNGELIPDLAKSYTVSDDGMNYTFTLKDNLTFQDGKKLNADDIIFTINRVQDPITKSPKRANWEGVIANKIDDMTISLHLKQPFSGFLENTTLGIIPLHIWQSISPEQMSLVTGKDTTIGSGPYKINSISTKSNGVISSLALSQFKHFSLGRPHIKNINLYFYDNEKDAINGLNNGTIKELGAISPENALSLKKNYNIITTPLPRIFALFFNQTKAPIFTNKKVVSAFSVAIDRDTLIKEVLKGYGQKSLGPIPTQFFDYNEILNNQNTNTKLSSIEKARTILLDDGWRPGSDGVLEKGGTKTTTITKKKGKKTIKQTITEKTPSTRLEFTLATSDTPELVQSANLIKQTLEQVGAKVSIQIYDSGALNANVIRPREYQALLFGQIINHETDLFAFWHSSQRNDPGLNIALYVNSKVDGLLEKTQIEEDTNKRNDLYKNIIQNINTDSPAIFLYSPEFIYITDKKINGLQLNNITNTSDRFINIYKWYEETESVWKYFNK